jgi:hypothetical protein
MIQTLIEKLIIDENENNLFSLSIREIEFPINKKCIYSITSDVIPHLMIKHFSQLITPKFIYKIDDGIKEIDNEYLTELLDFIGNEIKFDSDFKPFFYNKLLFLDSEKNVRTEITRQFKEAQKQLNDGDFEFINSDMNLHLFHFQQLFIIPKKYTKNEVFFKKISRTEFEKTINSIKIAEEYVEIYFHAFSFYQILNSEKNPLYFIILNIKKEPILVIKTIFLD